MEEMPFKIFVDRLRGEKEETISESLISDFLEVEEEDLRLLGPIDLQGKAYVVDQELYLSFEVSLPIAKPCSLCNQWGEFPINLSFEHAEPMKDIKTGVYNFKGLLREEILLAIPQYWKCHTSSCLGEKEKKKYFSRGEKGDFQENPFANIQLPEL